MVGTQFGMDAGAFGALNSVMAIVGDRCTVGCPTRKAASQVDLRGGGRRLRHCQRLAALAPNAVLFGLALVPCGLFALTLITSANGYVQSTTEAVMRGRVMSLYMAIFMGGTPIGAPLVGLVANVGGPRWAVGVAAVAGVSTAVVGLLWIIRAKQLRLRFDRRARGLKNFRVESLLSRPEADDDGAGRQGA